MSNDVVRWIRKSGKCSSLTRKKKQIYDYNDSTSSILDPVVSEGSATRNKNCDDNLLLNTIKNESNNHILVNFSILSNTVSSNRNSNIIGTDDNTSINNNTTNNIVTSATTIDSSSDTEFKKNTSNTAISYIKCDRCRLMNVTRNFSSTNCNINNNNNNNNYKKNSTITNNSNNNDILVIMSTLIKCRNRLRAFFSVLPIIIVIFQVNFIFSDLIVNVVATDNDLYINKYNNLVKEININNNNNNNGYDYMNNVNNMYPQGGHYTPTWAVHIPNGDNNGLADEVARDHGFINLGKIFDDHYHFEHKSLVKRSIEPSHHHQNRLNDDDRVQWSEQQISKSRQKRDFIRMRPSRTSSRAMSLVDSIQLNDPKWPQMWYLNRGGGLDMNVVPAWKEGITGKGVVVTILDDGLESDHPDLEHNYDPKASYDVNSHDEDPMPHYDMTDSNRHGTRCAGEVAATANNSLCAVGIAFGARVGGVRMLDGDVTDAVEARSLSLNPQHIDIYSASWGPDDDGKTVDGPGDLASRAFIEGVTKGRNGKGSIFIWASGNGGRELDNCNCDGYTNSIWTLSISSATEEGHVPWYSEKCSSTLATTYSSGGQNEKQVVTTDLHHSCTVSHTGTSASAPLAAGIVALVLEANRNLTWRDLQHIVVRTAKPGNLKDQSWSKNGVGRRVSHSFGYGLMDAAAMVKVARTWKTVPEQQRCEINAPHVDKMIPAKSYITLQLTVKHCMGVNFLEHVQAKITLTTQRRGDIQIYLKSPSGTRVTLLTSRMHDVSRSGFNQWPFMSVHTWGEAPHGNWQLEIHNEGRYMAQITQWDLIFYGTEKPAQPDDPVRISPGRYGGFGGELEHNHLDFDTETASGQWRNMQQVGESHVDVQRTTSNDQTSSACLDYAPDQRCIECHQTTFLYNGHCYTICPNGTYMIPEVPSFSPKTYIIEPMMMTSNERIDTYYGVNNDDNNTIDNFKQRAIMRPIPQKICAQCDPSCLNCHGPNAGDCTECLPGYQLRKIFPKDTFCYYLNERSSDNSAQGGISAQVDNYDNDDIAIRDDLYMFLIIIVPAISIIFLIVLLSIFGRKLNWLCNRDNNSYSYNRVAFNIDDDDDDVEEHDNNSSSVSGGVSKIQIDIEAQKISKMSKNELEIKKSLINNPDDSDDY